RRPASYRRTVIAATPGLRRAGAGPSRSMATRLVTLSAPRPAARVVAKITRPYRQRRGRRQWRSRRANGSGRRRLAPDQGEAHRMGAVALPVRLLGQPGVADHALVHLRENPAGPVRRLHVVAEQMDV